MTVLVSHAMTALHRLRADSGALNSLYATAMSACGIGAAGHYKSISCSLLRLADSQFC